MKPLFFFILCLFTNNVSAQIETNAIGLNGTDRTIIIQKDSSGCIFSPENDKSLKYYMATGFHTYKLWKNDTLILEGDLGGRRYVDYVKKFGSWTEYYSNGKMKATGFYDANNPVGVWKFFFPNGKLKNWFTISKIITDSTVGYCKTGYFENYYENGHIKTSGYFKIALDSMYEVLWVPYGRNFDKLKVIKAKGARSQPDLVWTYYKENGEIERKENY